MTTDGTGGPSRGDEQRTRSYAALATALVAVCTAVGGGLIFAIEHRAVGFANVGAGLALAGIAFAILRGSKPHAALVVALFVVSRAVAFRTEGLDTSVLFRTVVFGLVLYAALRPFYAADRSARAAVPMR
ncbi:MAG: hypothetical protein JWM27_1471 [Gemmatimonadetes bacterium]|nr:hypothetical protein [Gemmatimonadota bacterium]